MTILTRRSLLRGLFAAPAVIRTSGLLMPISVLPELMTLSLMVKRRGFLLEEQRTSGVLFSSYPIEFDRETRATEYIPSTGRLQEVPRRLGEIIEKPMGNGWVHVSKTVEVKRGRHSIDIALDLHVKEHEEVRMVQLETQDGQDVTPWKDWF